MAERYSRKLEILSQGFQVITDPYKIPVTSWKDDMTLWPHVDYGNIYAYLIDTPGQFTREKLRCHKSLDAFNYYISGWVQTVFYFDLTVNCVLKAKVRSSQRLNEKPHKAWVGVEKATGTIITGHCNCMAGLGEVCSHVAAILFKVEACIRLEMNKRSCTSLPCVWNETFAKNVQISPVVDLCFLNPSRKRTRAEALLKKHDEARRNSLTADHSCNEAKLDAKTKYDHMYKYCPNASVFSLLPDYTSDLHSTSNQLEPSLPLPLHSFYNPQHRLLSESSLTALSLETFKIIRLSKDESDFLEETTRDQCGSSTWYDYRKGLITSSHFHKVIHCNKEAYPTSIVKSIMQYYSTSANVPSLKWGRENEIIARMEYLKQAESDHVNFEFCNSGLRINPLYPYLGATPDGVITCDCCGTGVIEIKCPFKFREESPTSNNALSDRNFCLKSNDDGDVHLSNSHSYYDQVQGQLAICDVNYCDFICWTTKGIFVQRVTRDNNYFTDNLSTLKNFFIQYLLPELLTHNLSTSSEPSSSDPPLQVTALCSPSGVTSSASQLSPISTVPTQTYCLCCKEESGKMIACDNNDCKIEWFHFKCVGLKRAPAGKWFCPDCKTI